MSSISIFLKRGVMMAESYFLQIIGKMGILPTGKMYAVVSQSSVLQVVPRRVLKSDQVILNLVPEK